MTSKDGKVYLEIIFKPTGRCKSNTEILARPPRSDLELLCVPHTHSPTHTHPHHHFFLFLHCLTGIGRYHATSKSAMVTHVFVSCPDNVPFSKNEFLFSSLFLHLEEFCLLKASVKPSKAFVFSDFWLLWGGRTISLWAVLSVGLLCLLRTTQDVLLVRSTLVTLWPSWGHLFRRGMKSQLSCSLPYCRKKFFLPCALYGPREVLKCVYVFNSSIYNLTWNWFFFNLEFEVYMKIE